jgi:hypothetical protein
MGEYCANWGHFPKELLEGFYADYSERVDKSKMKCNDPKTTPDHPTKSHVVKACYPGAPKGGKLLRFGQQGVKGSPHKEGESEEYRKRRERFKARHAKNIAKGKSSPAYWANLWKWAESIGDPELLQYVLESKRNNQ